MLLELVPVIRYWELNAKELEAHLAKVRDMGATAIAAWVPWSHLETDRHHLLQKLLRQAFALKLPVKLGVSPELGIGYWNSGIPEDLLKERNVLAQDRTGQSFFSCTPPNIHPLPSLSAPAVFQRYGHFLLKLTQEITDTLTENSQASLEIIVSDGLFKHYKNSGLAADDHGDYSVRYLHQSSGGLSHGASPSGTESIFVNRSRDFLKSRLQKFSSVKIQEDRVFTRSASLDRLLDELVRAGTNLPSLFHEMTEARSHCSMVWLDDSYGLSDRERNFLLSAALICFQKVWISEEIFFQCTPAFRKRLQAMAAGFSGDQSTQIQKATVFVKNRFAPARLARCLRETLGTVLGFETLQFGPLSAELKTRPLLVVEEGLTLEYAQFKELHGRVKLGPCTVVLFKSSLCERALRELNALAKFQIHKEWSYNIFLHTSGGQLLVVEGQESAQAPMSLLGASIIAVAQLQPWCQHNLSHKEVFTVSLDWKNQEDSHVKTIFLLNPTPDAQPIQITFPKEAKVGGIFLGGERPMEPLRGEQFDGTLPAYSVVPLTVYLQEPEIQNDARSETKLA